MVPEFWEGRDQKLQSALLVWDYSAGVVRSVRNKTRHNNRCCHIVWSVCRGWLGVISASANRLLDPHQHERCNQWRQVAWEECGERIQRLERRNASERLQEITVAPAPSSHSPLCISILTVRSRRHDQIPLTTFRLRFGQFRRRGRVYDGGICPARHHVLGSGMSADDRLTSAISPAASTRLRQEDRVSFSLSDFSA